MQNFLSRAKKFKQKKRKNAFTLIEIVIAFTLLGALIYSLYLGFGSLSRAHIHFQQAQKESMDKAKLQLRLHQLLDALVEEVDSAFRFHTGYFPGSKHTALFFTFYPTDHDPKFAVPLNSVLFLDLKNRLQLLSKNSNGDERIEILAEKTEKVVLDFFDEEEKIWKNEWSKENPIPPLIVRIQLTFISKTEANYVFFLNPNPPPIIYPLEK